MASFDASYNSALQDLELLLEEGPVYSMSYCDALSKMIRHLRIFHVFASKWGSDYDDDSDFDDDWFSLIRLLGEIEDAVSTIAQSIHPFAAVIREGEGQRQRQRQGYLDGSLHRHLADAAVEVEPFVEEIKGWYIKFSDSSRQSTSSCSSGDLVEFIHSILGIANPLCHPIYEALTNLLETLEEQLIFFKIFIRLFTALQGEDGHMGQNLLTHIKAVAVSAAHHFFVYQFLIGFPNDYNKILELKSEISELLQRIKPVHPHVCQIYIQVLNRLKLSGRQPRSVVTLEILLDFIASLLSYLFGILKADITPGFSNKYRLHILYQGLRSLSVILKKQPKNFDEKMRDLTLVVACDAGVVIFSLFPDASKHNFAQEMDRVLSDLPERINLIRAEVTGISSEIGESSLFNFPKVDELGFVDFLMENLTELISCEEAAVSSIAISKHRIQTICEELVFLRSFLGKIVQLRDEKEEIRTLWNHIVEMAYGVEFLIDSFVIGDVPDDFSYQMSFDRIAQEINILKLEAKKISDKEDFNVAKRSNDFLPLERSMPIIKEDIIGMEDEARTIMERLKSQEKMLQIVPIVGMPGLGKTTIAKLIYNDVAIRSDFHVFAWCCISQVYNKKNLLCELLNCICSDFSDKCEEEDLANRLRQTLLRRRYLIVLDDVWNINAWIILKGSFPDDKNRSRILLTSRFQNIASDDALEGMIVNRKPHCLRPLKEDDSWKLLKSKLFPSCEWPETLCELGTRIVKRCNGLPLMIVILTGILATKKQNDWEEVVEHYLSSSSVDILEQCNNMLESTYRYLPDELKPCFLYFGAFLEDQEHMVSELILIWIAEGFVRKAPSKSLEDVAKDYLMHLINRSLVMVDKQSSTGMIKTCRIHDLLHMFCLEKAKKENFFQELKGYDEFSDFKESQNVCRLYIKCSKEHLKMARLSCPLLRSLFFYCSDGWSCSPFNGLNPLPYIANSKLVRVLDMRQSCIRFTFPNEITLMVQLRFLAVGGDFKSIPSSIANLSNLETWIVKSHNVIELPLGFWKLKKLRHLRSKKASFVFSGEYGNWMELFNLETFPTLCLCWRDLERVLKKFPNIRKLKVILKADGDLIGENNMVLVPDSLNKLESLCVSKNILDLGRHIDICFPSNLRKLTLEHLRWPWSKISAIGLLPKLEVLKLLKEAFDGETWSMEEAGQFPELRFLELAHLNIVSWTASESVRDHFPCLEKLVLYRCHRLKTVPHCLGDIQSLEMIRVLYCSKSAGCSVEKVCEEAMENGYLNVLIETAIEIEQILF